MRLSYLPQGTETPQPASCKARTTMKVTVFMATISIVQAPGPSGVTHLTSCSAIAQQLKNLDRCARTSGGAQGEAAKQQIDAAWRAILGRCPNAVAAHRLGAEVAGCMLGKLLLPQDLHRTRRTGMGTAMDAPYPIAARSLYALLHAWDLHDDTGTMEDAFANMKVASSTPAWHPSPPAPSLR